MPWPSLLQIVRRRPFRWVEQEPTDRRDDHCGGGEKEHAVPLIAVREAAALPGEQAAPKLPNMLPQPRNEATWRPPMSW